MNELEKDETFTWKSSIMHHMMFGLQYSDYEAIIDKFLPLAQKHKYDLFINGHEHQMNYAFVKAPPSGKISTLGQQSQRLDVSLNGTTNGSQNTQEEQCLQSTEVFPQKGPEERTRQITVPKGDRLNQVTLGAAGRETYPICPSNLVESQGQFIYGQNKYNGFGLVHVTAEAIEVMYKGVERGGGSG